MRVLLAIVAVGVLAAPASATAPKMGLTAAGNAAARKTLLTAKLMGSGWTALTPVTAGVDLSCKGDTTSGAGIEEVGAAEQPDLKGGTAGPIISQTTSVYATAAQASALWRRAVTPKLVTCVRESLQAISAKGITTKILSQGALKLTAAPATSAAYRVVADLVSKARTLKTYFDVVLVRHGKTISELTIATFTAPVTPADAEGALATLVYHDA
jgi:hypothetical protein